MTWFESTARWASLTSRVNILRLVFFFSPRKKVWNRHYSLSDHAGDLPIKATCLWDHVFMHICLLYMGQKNKSCVSFMWSGWWRSHCYSWCSWIWRVPPCSRSKPSRWHMNSHKIVTLVRMLHCMRGLRNIQKGQQLCYTVDFLELFPVALGKKFFCLSRKRIPCQLWVDQGKCNAQIQCSFGIYPHTGSYIRNFWKHFKHKSAGSYATMDRRSAFASCYRLHLRMPYFTLLIRRVNIGFCSFL